MIQLYHGDCLDVMPTLEAQSFDAIIADLPYGTTACKWDVVIPFEPLWREYKRLIKPRGAVVLFGSQPFTSLLVTSNLAWFRYEWVWVKSKQTGFLDAKRKPLKKHETMSVFSSNGHVYNPQMVKGEIHKRGRQRKAKNEHYGEFRDFIYTSDEYYPQSVVNFASVMKPDHPTQKPTALLEYLIRTYTNEGGAVLDNVMGSGTTGVACQQTGRSFVGIEKDAGYFEIAKRRIETAQLPLLEAA